MTELTPRERGFRDAMQAAREAHARHEPPDVIAIAAIKAFEDAQREPPPEGKLRVRGSVALTGDGAWTLAGYHQWDDERARQEGKFMGKSAQYRWVEVDVTPWQPPAEETVQGREVTCPVAERLFGHKMGRPNDGVIGGSDS